MTLNDTVYAFISDAAFSNNASRDIVLTNEDWGNLYSEFLMQAIICFPYRLLSRRMDFPSEYKELWRRQVISNHLHTVQIMRAQDEVIKQLNAEGIDVVVIKGSSAAMYYHELPSRSSGDIDIYVKEKDYLAAQKIILGLGYVPELEKYYHIEYLKLGISVELHRSLGRVVSGKHSKNITKLLAAGMDDIQHNTLAGYDIPSFPSLQNGMILLMHIQQHLPGGLGFKQITDWMMYVNRELHDGQWEKYKPYYVKCGLVEPAILVTRMCQMYLGLNSIDITWCKSADEERCHQLIEYISVKGNFGRKECKTEKGVFALTRDKSLKVKFERYQHHGEINWKALEKHPGLRRFAWLYTMCTYASFVLKREHPIKSLSRDLRISKKRKALFKCMNVYVK